MSNKYSPDNYGEDLLEEMEKEHQRSASKRDDNNIKLENDGDIWLIRFFPAQLGIGEKKTFYAPIAQHWVNKRPHFCERATHPNAGGNPGAHCPLCDLTEDAAEKYRGSNRDLSTYAFRASASTQWLTYALVWSKEIKGQDPMIPQGDAQWQPYRFWLNRTNWNELYDQFMRFRKRYQHPLSILDPDRGVDFYVKRANGKVNLQRDEIRSIFPDDYRDEDKTALMEYIHSLIKMPSYKPLGSQEMDAACAKFEEGLRKMESGSYRGGNSRNMDEDEDRPSASSSRQAPRAPARPSAPPARPAPPRPPASQAPSRPAPRAQYDMEGPEEAQEPVQRPAPPRPPTRTHTTTSARSVPSAPPRSVPSARPRPLSEAEMSENQDEIPMDFEKAPEPQKPVETPSSRLRQAARNVPEPEKPKASMASSVDDDDDVTDETHDVVSSSSPDAIEAEVDAPPAPVEKVQRPASRMSDKLRSAINRVQ